MLTDTQRHALRWVLLEAIELSNARRWDLEEDSARNEYDDIQSLIEIAHLGDRDELEKALSESPIWRDQ